VFGINDQTDSGNSPGFQTLVAAIVKDDVWKIRELLRKDRRLTKCSTQVFRQFVPEISHWFYKGDTPLHFAAAGHRPEIAEILLKGGADPDAALNHRWSRPLHYAADGYINSELWDSERQVMTMAVILNAGADINAGDKNGATPLHRAVRTRCAGAVRLLLQSGGDPTIPNKSGSTPFHLAVQNTGRGGSGTEKAKIAQREIINWFQLFRTPIVLKDGHGKTVLECARSDSIRALLT
jgi:hypothetical protein